MIFCGFFRSGSRRFNGSQFWKQPTRKQQVPCRTMWTLQRCLRLGTKSPTVCNEFERCWAVTIRLKSFCFSEGQHCSVSSFHCSACVVWRPLCSSNASTRPEWQSEDGLRVFLDFAGHVRFPLACLALMRDLQMKAHILQQNSYVVL